MLMEIIKCCIAVAGVIILFSFGVFVGKNFGDFEKFLIELLNKFRKEE